METPHQPRTVLDTYPNLKNYPNQTRRIKVELLRRFHAVKNVLESNKQNSNLGIKTPLSATIVELYSLLKDPTHNLRSKLSLKNISRSRGIESREASYEEIKSEVRNQLSNMDIGQCLYAQSLDELEETLGMDSAIVLKQSENEFIVVKSWVAHEGPKFSKDEDVLTLDQATNRVSPLLHQIHYKDQLSIVESDQSQANSDAIKSLPPQPKVLN